MKISVILTGKTRTDYVLSGTRDFAKRIRKYIGLEEIIVPERRISGKMSEEEVKQKEGDKILARLEDRDRVVLLDERGRGISSQELAGFLHEHIMSRTGRLIFIVGGAYGFSEEVYKRANFSLSLSKMTFPHELVRLIFYEQLYRAFTIIRGEPYHHN